MTKSYPAKILLFGEHSVLKGSSALAVPTNKFNGKWTFEQRPEKLELSSFLAYLKSNNQELNPNLNLSTFEADIAKGISFTSNIPIGYGLGSSAALCAGVYDRYANQKEIALPNLKTIFAKLESHFHGNSSGFDPLVSYINQPILKQGQAFEIVPHQVKLHNEQYQLFLIDTKQGRHTGILVEWFLKQCEQTTYYEQVLAYLIPAVEEAISALSQEQFDLLFDTFHQISLFQHRYFQPMIIEPLNTLWLEGLSSDYFKLKVCGAGGGGFYLGITSDLERLAQKTDFPLVAL